MKSASAPSRSEQRILTTRPPLDRMGRVLVLLMKNPGINRKELARELETTVKTIQRDLNFLRSRWKVPIYYHHSLNGFALEDGWEKQAALIPQLAFSGQEGNATQGLEQESVGAKKSVSRSAPEKPAWPPLPIITDPEVPAQPVSIELSETGIKLFSRSRRLGGLKFRRLKNGAQAVSFKVAKLEDAEPWILSWGEHAKVLAPRALAERIQSRLQATQDRYS